MIVIFLAIIAGMLIAAIYQGWRMTDDGMEQSRRRSTTAILVGLGAALVARFVPEEGSFVTAEGVNSVAGIAVLFVLQAAIHAIVRILRGRSRRIDGEVLLAAVLFVLWEGARSGPSGFTPPDQTAPPAASSEAERNPPNGPGEDPWGLRAPGPTE